MKNLLLFLAPLLIPVIILGTLSIVVTKQYIRGEMNKSNLALFNQIDRQMTALTDELDSLYVGMGNPEIVFRLGEMMRTQSLKLENLRLMKTMLNYLNGPANAKPYMESIYVYVNNDHGQFLASGEGLVRLEGFSDAAWLDGYAAHAEQTDVWTEARRIRRYAFEAPTDVITLYQNLVSNVNNRPGGVIAINIDTGYIERLLADLTVYAGQEIRVLDGGGETVFRTPSRLETPLPPPGGGAYSERPEAWRAEGTSYLISRFQAKSGWTYVSITPKSSLNRIPFQLSALTVFFVLLSFSLGLALTWLLTKRNVRHIRRIVSLIQHAEAGAPLPEAASGRRTDEYGYIAQGIIKNFIERNHLSVRLTEEKYKLRTAELLALQAQINPHFLFNTLQTIYWKVLRLTGRPNEANAMLESLSSLLKYSLDTPNEIVPLEQEIESAKTYIRIQKTRYKERFETIWQYDAEDLRGAGIIRLLLQPLIENCMSHGLREEGRLRVKIKLIRLSGQLRIVVIDDGPGMEANQLGELRARMETEDEVFRHIGLFNTSRRIKLTYPASAGLTILSKRGRGTVVAITLPLRPVPG
ncbi:sensor histidine kinase [Cohnella cellulosilytica]|uniref:Sensor histidine kinase n=1 Tax=Cohnella cellulosilytica TaxID=986710 RepID=A0ABW2FJU2_9BACL